MNAQRRCTNAPAGHITLVIGNQCWHGALVCISDQPVLTPWWGGREGDGLYSNTAMRHKRLVAQCSPSVSVMRFQHVGASAFSTGLGERTLYTPGTRVCAHTSMHMCKCVYAHTGIQPR